MGMAEFERKYRDDPRLSDNYTKLWHSVNMVNEFLTELNVPERIRLELSASPEAISMDWERDYQRSRCCVEKRVLRKTNITLIRCQSRPPPGGDRLVTIGSVVISIPLCEKHYRQLPKASQGMAMPFHKSTRDV